MTLNPTSSRGGGASTLSSPNAGIWLPAGWDTAWQAALALSSSQLAKIAVVSDSTGRGYFASVLDTKGWAGIVRASLQASYGDGGIGFISAGADLGLNIIGSGVPAGYAAQMKVASSGSWVGGVSSVNSGPGVSGSTASATPGDTMTFTSVRGTVIDLYYLKGAGLGDFTYNIDGAGPVTINTAGASGTGLTTVSGLAAGTHTVVLTVTVGGGGVQINGVRGRNATGVLIDNYSSQGAKAANWTGNATFGTPALWSGGNSNQADLIIASMGLNDDTSAVTAAAFIQSIVTALNSAKEGTNPTSLLIMPAFAAAGWSANLLLQQYTTQLQALATYYGCGILSMGGRYNGSWQQARNQSYWSTGAGASGGPGNDTVHPGDIGHAIWGNQLIALLTRQTPTTLV